MSNGLTEYKTLVAVAVNRQAATEERIAAIHRAGKLLQSGDVADAMQKEIEAAESAKKEREKERIIARLREKYGLAQ
jgi:hypothetical protein